MFLTLFIIVTNKSSSAVINKFADDHPVTERPYSMTKKVLVILPDAVHATLREYQIDRTTKDRAHTSLSTLIAELVEKSPMPEQLKTELRHEKTEEA
jgi:hypothetical protein